MLTYKYKYIQALARFNRHYIIIPVDKMGHSLANVCGRCGCTRGGTRALLGGLMRRCRGGHKRSGRPCRRRGRSRCEQNGAGDVMLITDVFFPFNFRAKLM